MDIYQLVQISTSSEGELSELKLNQGHGALGQYKASLMMVPEACFGTGWCPPGLSLGEPVSMAEWILEGRSEGK